MTRETFLARVRAALHRSPQDPGEAPPPPAEPSPGGGLEGDVERFVDVAREAGMRVWRENDLEAARRRVRTLAAAVPPGPALVARDAAAGAFAGALDRPAPERPEDAVLGLSGVLRAVARTGSLMLTSDAGRLPTLLPMHHLALVFEAQVVPDLAHALRLDGDPLPAAWVLCSGPSRTADIEMTLTTGVHGPGEVDVVLVKGPVPEGVPVPGRAGGALDARPLGTADGGGRGH